MMLISSATSACSAGNIYWRLRGRLDAEKGYVVRAGEHVEKGGAVAIIDDAVALYVYVVIYIYL